MKSIEKVEVFLNMMKAAGAQLESQREEVDNLNVFPVPDGDTGTNMYLTIKAALKYIEDNRPETFSQFSESLSKGALMGARGNSGVILSQIFRGIAMGIQDQKVIDGKVLAQAFTLGEEIAYQAVKKPVEGTILTVMKGIKEGANKSAIRKNDFLFVLEESIKAGNKSLEKTPKYLPVLKESGVVDAGGKGLMVILEGLYRGALGKSVVFESPEDVIQSPIFDEGVQNAEDIKVAYCTEFIILNPTKGNEQLRKDLDEPEKGDSLITIVADGIAKIHMHTNHPGELIEYAIGVGPVTNIKIDNMLEQFAQKHPSKGVTKKTEKQKPFGFVMVVPGSGLGDIAKSMGVDAILNGGQTMNPSTHDIQEAIATVHAKVVYVLPNNKNIILASEQAAELVRDKKVIVVPSTNIPEGFNSLLAFNEAKKPKENLIGMKASFKDITAGAITYAVRDTSVNGLSIKKNQMLSMVGKEIVGATKTIDESVDIFLEKAYKNQDMLTLYTGNMVSKEEGEKMKERIEKKYPELEVVLFEGKQPVYYYILSLE